MKRIRWMIVAFVLVAFAGGCTNTVRSMAPAPPPSEIAYEQVITDPIVNAFAHVVSVREARSAGGYLQVQVDIYNKLPWRKSVNYRFEWMDAAGMVLSSSPADVWLLVVMEAKGTSTLQSTAPTSAAADFRLQLSGAD